MQYNLLALYIVIPSDMFKSAAAKFVSYKYYIYIRRAGRRYTINKAICIIESNSEAGEKEAELPGGSLTPLYI